MKRMIIISASILVAACLLALVACGGVLGFGDKDEDPSVDEHAHSYGQWTVVTEAKCDTEGLRERVCSCGDKQTEAIPALGHTVVVDPGKEATCTESGLTDGSHCSVCGAVLSAQVEYSAKGHVERFDFADNGNGTHTKTYSCCGTVADTEEAHNFVRYAERAYLKEAATCVSNAIYYVSCADCGAKGTDTFEVCDENKHSFEENPAQRYLVSDATCTACAVYKKSCKYCGIASEETFTYGQMLEHTLECVEDEEYLKLELSCDHLETFYKRCAVCGAKSEETFTSNKALLPHTLVENPVIEYLKSPATCTSPAIYYKSCSVCNQAGEETFEYGDALGHDYAQSGLCSHDECTARCSAGLSYQLNEEGTEYTVIGIGTCKDSVIVLPDVYRGKRVTTIGEMAFRDCDKLTGITIPEGITTIGGWAFDGCIGITELAIPASATDIAGSAFANCTALTNITVADGNNTYRAENKCLIQSETNTLIAGCKESTIPAGVEAIGDYAFYGCTGLQSVTLPDSVTGIGDYAFWNCGISAVQIPAAVTEVGESAFCFCTKLTSVTVAAGNTAYKATSNCLIENETSTLIVGCANSTIPSDVTTIGKYAFYGSKLTSFTIPAGVTSIGDYAFCYCAELTQINVDSNNTVYHAEGNCLIETESNTLITGCKQSQIPNDGTVTVIADYAFYGVNGLTTITLPDALTTIGDHAFDLCTGLTSINIPSDVTAIGNYSFHKCSKLECIEIPDAVTTIGEYAFHGCKDLTEVTGMKGLTVIGNNAFSSCTALKTFELPNSLTNIGSYAFFNCSALTSVTIRAGVQEIGERAFAGCSGLTSIVVETDNQVYRSMTNCLIDQQSNTLIAGCKESKIPGTVVRIADFAFYNCTGLTEIVIPESVTAIGSYGFAGCTGLTTVVIPGSVQSIGEFAFKGCTGLESVSISEGVTNLDFSMFSGCTELKTVWISGGVKYISVSVFSDCSALTDIHFSGTMAQWEAVNKVSGWNTNTGSYTVRCSDGNLDKDGNPITSEE